MSPDFLVPLGLGTNLPLNHFSKDPMTTKRALFSDISIPSLYETTPSMQPPIRESFGGQPIKYHRSKKHASWKIMFFFIAFCLWQTFIAVSARQENAAMGLPYIFGVD